MNRFSGIFSDISDQNQYGGYVFYFLRGGGGGGGGGSVSVSKTMSKHMNRWTGFHEIFRISHDTRNIFVYFGMFCSTMWVQDICYPFLYPGLLATWLKRKCFHGIFWICVCDCSTFFKLGVVEDYALGMILMRVNPTYDIKQATTLFGLLEF